ncbi:transposase [Methyloglobulus sp.]|uniref:transposase n=1 Tax=Methyloglobulus sp. TaxID=2518622 RepID=UPI0032B876F3
MYTERRTNSAFFYSQEDRRSYPAHFKAQVALEALKNEKTNTELAIEFAVHPNQVSLWKQQFVNNINRVFDNDSTNLESSPKTTNGRHAQIGQLMAENDFLTKVLGR